MRKHTLTALVVGILAITALGIWWAPSLKHRDTQVAEPAAAVEPSPAEDSASIVVPWWLWLYLAWSLVSFLVYHTHVWPGPDAT